MILDPEIVYAALWARVSGLGQFKTKHRRLKHFDDVMPPEQPALFMVQGGFRAAQIKGIPPTWTLSPRFYLYDVCPNDPEALPGQRLTALFQAVDRTLAPNVDGRQTLGGLVSHCWCTGCEYFEGYAGMMDQSVAIMSIEIKVPDASGPI